MPLLEKGLHLLFGHPANPPRRPKPKGIAVIHDAGDVVAEQTVFRRNAREFIAVERVQPSLEGGDPQRSIPFLEQRSNLVARKTVRRGEVRFLVPLNSPQALLVGARPKGAVHPLIQSHHGGQGGLHFEPESPQEGAAMRLLYDSVKRSDIGCTEAGPGPKQPGCGAHFGLEPGVLPKDASEPLVGNQ